MSEREGFFLNWSLSRFFFLPSVGGKSFLHQLSCFAIKPILACNIAFVGFQYSLF